MSSGDERQGNVALGLSEYTSRYCRLRLVDTSAAGIERELNDKHDRGVSQLAPRVGAASVLAGILGVHVRTVQRWLSGGVQSCNVNAEKLIKVALEYASEETRRLLVEDLAQHEAELESLIGNLNAPDHAEEEGA